MVDTRGAVTRYVEALNGGDADAIAAAVSEDFLNEHTSALGASVQGRAAYRRRLDGFLATFAHLRYAVEDVIVDGERAAVPYTMTCRWRDDTGSEHPVELRGIFRFTVRDGLVAHRIDYWDGLEFQRQLRPRSA